MENTLQSVQSAGQKDSAPNGSKKNNKLTRLATKGASQSSNAYFSIGVAPNNGTGTLSKGQNSPNSSAMSKNQFSIFGGGTSSKGKKKKGGLNMLLASKSGSLEEDELELITKQSSAMAISRSDSQVVLQQMKEHVEY